MSMADIVSRFKLGNTQAAERNIVASQETVSRRPQPRTDKKTKPAMRKKGQALPHTHESEEEWQTF